MPLVDLPLEELLKYRGRNPRPADFNAFWNNSLAEMEAVDPQIELRRHPIDAPFAQCFDLRFWGVGGARIYAKYVRPAHADGPVPWVLQFHGYAGASSTNWSDYSSKKAKVKS